MPTEYVRKEADPGIALPCQALAALLVGFWAIDGLAAGQRVGVQGGGEMAQHPKGFFYEGVPSQND